MVRIGGKNIKDDLVGAAGVVIIEPILDQFVGQFTKSMNIQGLAVNIDDLAKFFLIAPMMAKQKGFIGSAGRTLRVVSAVRLVEGLLKGFSLFGGAGTQPVNTAAALTMQQKRDPILNAFR